MAKKSDSTQKISRNRLREFGEPIAASPNLREALNDEQASELIEWGLAALQKWIEDTIDQADEAVHSRLELKATAVTLIMELVNQMMAHPGRMPNEDIVNDRAVRLGKNLFWLTGNKNRKAYRLAYAKYEAIRETAVPDVLFKHIMAIIYVYDDVNGNLNS